MGGGCDRFGRAKGFAGDGWSSMESMDWMSSDVHRK